MSNSATVSVHPGDDVAGARLGTAQLVLDGTILLDPALAAALLAEHGPVERPRRPVQALIADVPLTVRIATADGVDEVHRTDGLLHVTGAPGVAPLVAVDLDGRSHAEPTPITDLPEDIRTPLAVLESIRDSLPRSPAPTAPTAPIAPMADGAVDGDLDGDGVPDVPDPEEPPPSMPPLCFVFPWLPPC